MWQSLAVALNTKSHNQPGTPRLSYSMLPLPGWLHAHLLFFAGMVYIDLEDNLSRHPKSTAYWFSKYFFNAAPQPSFTTKQRQAAAAYASAKAGLQRAVSAEPLAVNVGPAMKPIVKVAAALGMPIGDHSQQQQVAGRGFVLPLHVDVSKHDGTFSFQLGNGRKK
jgi:hypothetical protein